MSTRHWWPVWVFLAALAPRAAAADTFVTAETPAAFAVSDAQEGLFRPGAMPAFGGYTGTGRIAFGARVRFGALDGGPPPAGHLMEPHYGGLASVGAAVRLFASPRHVGPWVEGVAGGGVTGDDVVPILEGGVGWDIAAGSIDIGPSARYMRLVASSADRLGDAGLVLVGVDVRFGRPAVVHRAAAAPVPAAAPPPPPPAPPPPPPELDDDAITDALPSCAEDSDACPISQDIVLVDNRIVLDDRVLFALERAHVTSAGREIVAAIAKAWREHPEWTAVTIEGHTDLRGSDDYNPALSERRANAVRAVLIRAGADEARVDAVGYGRSRPRDAGSDEAAHQRNRRVEFVVHTGSAP